VTTEGVHVSWTSTHVGRYWAQIGTVFLMWKQQRQQRSRCIQIFLQPSLELLVQKYCIYQKYCVYLVWYCSLFKEKSDFPCLFWSPYMAITVQRWAPPRHCTIDLMLLPSGNPFKCHEEVLYLQLLTPPKRFGIFSPLTGGCSEGLRAFNFFLKHTWTYSTTSNSSSRNATWDKYY